MHTTIIVLYSRVNHKMLGIVIVFRKFQMIHNMLLYTCTVSFIIFFLNTELLKNGMIFQYEYNTYIQMSYYSL